MGGTAFGKPYIRDNQMHPNSSFVLGSMNRRHHPVTLLQATQESPTLARLSELTRDSVARLAAVQALIPTTLRASVTAGPIDGLVWCLLLDNNATAAKMRQLVPSLQSHLRTKGWVIDSIRLKVQNQSTK